MEEIRLLSHGTTLPCGQRTRDGIIGPSVTCRNAGLYVFHTHFQDTEKGKSCANETGLGIAVCLPTILLSGC